MDYSDLTDEKDFKAAFLVSNAVADLVLFCKDHFNVNLENIHMVGFGLGAQIAGLAGQNVFQHCGEKVSRITALDPAGILFAESTPDNEKLSPDDANYVEGLHTNVDTYGYGPPCGHVDYYPNGGKIQPGCNITDKMCSHSRAYKLIPEMWLPIENQELLILKCQNLNFISLDSCRWQSAKMGELGQQPKGLYYVETNDKTPFGKGAFKTQFL